MHVSTKVLSVYRALYGQILCLQEFVCTICYVYMLRFTWTLGVSTEVLWTHLNMYISLCLHTVCLQKFVWTHWVSTEVCIDTQSIQRGFINTLSVHRALHGKAECLLTEYWFAWPHCVSTEVFRVASWVRIGQLQPLSSCLSQQEVNFIAEQCDKVAHFMASNGTLVSTFQQSGLPCRLCSNFTNLSW